MQVKFFATIRSLSGRLEDQVGPVTPPTVRGLLAELSGRYGGAFRDRMFDGAELSSTIIILVNGRHIEHLAGLETPVGNDDVIAIFPVVAGG